MLKQTTKKLDLWVQEENRRRLVEGIAALGAVDLFVIGQTALLETQIGIELAATMAVDLYKQIHGEIRRKLEELLAERGRSLDPTGHEAWMPEETEFEVIFQGKLVRCLIAKPEYVLISKTRMAPQKNRTLLIEYLGGSPSQLFEQLAAKYKIDLESLLNDEP